MKLLNELTTEELKELYNNNTFLREQTAEEAAETVSFWLDEVLDNFRNCGGVDYNIGYPGNYFTFLTSRAGYNDYKAFFEICTDLNHDFCIFSDRTTELLKRVNDRLVFYLESIFGCEDISDDNQEKITEWIDKKVISALCSDILDFCVSDYDAQFDNDYLINEALPLFVENCGDNYETDGQYIYETTRRRFA